jgi:hypothetical protein
MIFDTLDEINWLAVIASTAAAFVIGVAWFSPPIFGGVWARQVSRYTSRDEAEIASDASRTTALSGWLGSIAVTAVVMAMVVEAVDADSAGEGAVLAFVIALGFGATFASWPPIFARVPWQWWLVNTGAFLVMQVAMGVILAIWS